MSKKNINEAVGNAFEDLNAEEMAAIQGAGDVDGEVAKTVSILTATVVGPISVVSVVHSCRKC